MVTKFMTTDEFLQWCVNYVKEDIQALIDKGDFKAVVEKYYSFRFPLVTVFGAHVANGYFYDSPTEHTPEHIIAPVCARLEQEVDLAIEEVYEDFSEDHYDDFELLETESDDAFDERLDGMDICWLQNIDD